MILAHLKIAKIINKKIFLFSTNKFSSSTGKKINLAMGTCSCEFLNNCYCKNMFILIYWYLGNFNDNKGGGNYPSFGPILLFPV